MVKENVLVKWGCPGTSGTTGMSYDAVWKQRVMVQM